MSTIGVVDRPPLTLRPVQTADLDALYAISLATGDSGGDASAFYRDPRLIGHIYVAPYALLSPQTAFVAEDDQGVAGYVVGVDDTRDFDHRLERDWWPALRPLYPDPIAVPPADWNADQLRSYLIHHPYRTPEAVISEHPGHLHMNLLPRLQRQGVGRRLLDLWIDAAKGRDVPAVHVGVNADNTGGLAFWRAGGFTEIAPNPAKPGRTIWLGRRL